LDVINIKGRSNDKYYRVRKTIEKSEEASKLKFSEEVLRIQGETKLFIPMEEAESLYLSVDQEISFISEYYEFVQNGIKHLETQKRNNSHVFHMNAFAFFRIRKIYEKLDLTLPSWVPNVWLLEKPYRDHGVTYLFDWSTVKASQISNTLVAFLMMRLSGEIKPAEPNSLSDNPKLQMLKKSGNLPRKVDNPDSKVTGIMESKDTRPAQKSNIACSDENLPEEVNHGSFVAKKYLMLMKSATDRNLDFDLSIEDLSQMLRKQQCYFTGEPLVRFVHCKEKVNSGETELPSNYLTVDRLDSEKGYVSGNVVICSNEINQLKDRMPAEEFSKAIAMRKLLREANMSPEMMRIIAG
jgi:hypothetical protein|tara:strand:- start:4583 stop:5641 length:1059 start_codon:yes stop_codon:yes gene_type:complete